MSTKNRFVPAALVLAALCVSAGHALAQDGEQGAITLEQAAAKVVAEVRETEAELEKLRLENTARLLPLRSRLSELQQELIRAESAAEEARSKRNLSATRLVNLTKEIDTRRQTTTRLTGLFGEYSRNFESRLLPSRRAPTRPRSPGGRRRS